MLAEALAAFYLLQIVPFVTTPWQANTIRSQHMDLKRRVAGIPIGMIYTSLYAHAIQRCKNFYIAQQLGNQNASPLWWMVTEYPACKHPDREMNSCEGTHRFLIAAHGRSCNASFLMRKHPCPATPKIKRSVGSERGKTVIWTWCKHRTSGWIL